MSDLHTTNTFNVEATINNWLMSQFNAINKPSWLPSVAIILLMPEEGIITPGISIFHMPGFVRQRWQGGQTGAGRGARAVNLLDVSCWVSRGDTVNGQDVWVAQLATLRSMVEGVFAGRPPLQLEDYLTDPANPVGVGYKIDFGDLESPAVMHDPNPDIERARYLIRYEWTVRQIT